MSEPYESPVLCAVAAPQRELPTPPDGFEWLVNSKTGEVVALSSGGREIHYVLRGKHDIPRLAKGIAIDQALVAEYRGRVKPCKVEAPAAEKEATVTDCNPGLAKNNDDEEKHAVQRCLDQAAPGQARVDRAANGYLDVFVRIQGAPEVFSCLRDLHYSYVAYLGSSFHLLVKDEPWLLAGRR